MKRKADAQEGRIEDANAKRVRLVHKPWLPAELWAHVFSFLHPKTDRWRVSLVCAEWNRLSWDVMTSCPIFAGMAFVAACERGCAETANQLVEGGRVDLSRYGIAGLHDACKGGHANVVRLLLACSCVDPTDYENMPIRTASRYGHADVVKMLLARPDVDPAVANNYPLRIALLNRHYDVANQIVADSRVVPFNPNPNNVPWMGR